MTELKEALEVIRDYCEKTTECSSCDINKLIGKCVADTFTVPEEWDIIEED